MQPTFSPESTSEGGGQVPAVDPLVPSPYLPRPYRVLRRRRELHDTSTLELEPADGTPCPTFAPGQFNMLYLFGVGEIPISISGDPTRPGPLVHTIRAVGAVSRGLCALKRGQVLGLRGPYGQAWPVGEAVDRDVVIVAGGIGLAPLRPAIYHLLAERQNYGRIVILYGARQPREMLYVRQLESWRGRFDLQLEATVDHATSGWLGPVGVVTELIERAKFDPGDTLAMTCGPEIMMRFAIRQLEAAGVAPECIFLSMERNMKCAVGFCGHCQLGPEFLCKDGPVFSYPRIAHFFKLREV